jgi:dihydrofolate synthase/folylpolyglutamate synthase
MYRLLAALGNPEKNFRCLHVAGTNGKGSVCAFTESILRESGLRTGLYTSPHLVDFAERIRISGKMIGSEMLEEGIVRLCEATKEWAEEEQPTFFELVTALAFDSFARSGCEVVVLETGLGGRLDATNTTPKIACAITPIALDHTEWLGETFGEIAREKAGVFRAGVPVVIAPQEPEAAAALEAAAREGGSPCVWVRQPLDGIPLGLAGSHQRWNAALSVALIRAARFEFPRHVVTAGLAATNWPGRFHRLRGGCLILDGAHNLHAARQLVTTWREEFGERRCRLIFGALSDKAPEALLAELSPLAYEVLLVPVASPRSADPAVLAKKAALLEVPVRVFGSLKDALEATQRDIFQYEGGARALEGSVLLAGSLFLVGEALALEAGGGVLPRNQ